MAHTGFSEIALAFKLRSRRSFVDGRIKGKKGRGVVASHYKPASRSSGPCSTNRIPVARDGSMSSARPRSYVWARDTGPEARGEEFQSKARLFHLATSHSPMAWPVGALSRRTGMNNAG